jgi:hypothetical protein
MEIFCATCRARPLYTLDDRNNGRSYSRYKRLYLDQAASAGVEVRCSGHALQHLPRY